MGKPHQFRLKYVCEPLQVSDDDFFLVVQLLVLIWKLMGIGLNGGIGGVEPEHPGVCVLWWLLQSEQLAR